MSLDDQLQDIQLMIFDVDGVLVNGIIFVGDSEEAKVFNVQDGFGFTMLHQAGIQTGILTGRACHQVKRRAEALKIKHYKAGYFHKGPAIQEMMRNAGVTKEQTLYMGDDILDLICAEYAGVFVAPANAVARVKATADIITERTGGQGAAREIIDTVLAAKGVLQETEDFFIGESA